MVALGYELYGSCAVNLVKSIKAYEPAIEVCLVHDSKSISHLSPDELKLFNHFAVADPSDYMVLGRAQYQRMKLCVSKYTPFEKSLYIDVDTMWFPKKKISELINHFTDLDFFIGKNGEYNPLTKTKAAENYTFWGDIRNIVNYYKLKNPVPQTISGVFWFKKSGYCESLFKRCLDIYDDQRAPCVKWANGKADEFCFNVALSEMNFKQQNSHLVYFDKTNGVITREQMYNNFWGIAAGGNKLIDRVRELYNDLVDLYYSVFPVGIKRYHVDKAALIKERRNF